MAPPRAAPIVESGEDPRALVEPLKGHHQIGSGATLLCHPERGPVIRRGIAAG
jgi:hypothetical protein